MTGGETLAPSEPETGSRVRLRPDVRIVRTGPQHYVLFDPRTGKRFTFSPRERQLLHLLDGRNDLAGIRTMARERYGLEVSRRDVRDFVNQLAEAALLADGARDSTAAAPRDLFDEHPQVPSTTDPRLNRRLDLLVLLFGWAYHPLLLPAYLAFIAVGAVELVRHFDLYLYDMTVLADEVPVWALMPLSLLQTIVFMNLPRELAVATACRRFGGWVRWFGVFWLNGMLPFFLCETGDSISRMSMRGRWTVLLSGLIAHSLLGAFYTLLWRMSEPHSFPAVFGMLQILPWFVATFLHLNIFVRLDLYRMLCVVRGDPQLWERARAETDAWLSMRPSPQALAPDERFWLRVYGLGWHVWIWLLRLAYVLGGGGWLVLRMGGGGALLFAVVLIAWYRKPIGRLAMAVTPSSWTRGGGKWWIRWPVRLVILLGIVALGFIPYTHEVGGDCRVAPAAEQGIRAQVTDEVIEVRVKEGDWVEAGDVIATLSGREARAARDERAAEVRAAQADLDLLLAGSRQEDITLAEQEVALWRVRLEYAQSEFTRVDDLLKRGVGDEQEVRDARVEVDSSQELLGSAQEKLKRVKEGARPEEIEAARARVESAAARLAYAETQVSLLTIRAPIAGRIVTPNVRQRVGQVVQSGELIATVQDTRTLSIVVDADETATAVREGLDVKCRLWGLDGALVKGVVREVCSVAFDEQELQIDSVRSDREALIEQSSARPRTERRVRLFVDLERQDGRLRPGMTGKARIVLGDDLLWRAVWRPIARYFKVAVWSWLP